MLNVQVSIMTIRISWDGLDVQGWGLTWADSRPISPAPGRYHPHHPLKYPYPGPLIWQSSRCKCSKWIAKVFLRKVWLSLSLSLSDNKNKINKNLTFFLSIFLSLLSSLKLTEETARILVEFLEVAVSCIVFLKGFYPTGNFCHISLITVLPL